MNELCKYQEKVFDSFRIFKVINKVRISCELSDNNIDDHFPVNGKMVD